MSDDIDSLVGATILKQVKEWEVQHFYDFHNLYSTNKKDLRKAVGVDIALVNGRTFDNHVTMLSSNSKPNIMSANPNIIERISIDNYTDKYAMSTALLLWSLYDLPLPSTEDGKLMLMAIDSSYLGYYDYKGRFRETQCNWLEKMGMEEIIRLQERHTLTDFIEVKRRYDSSEKIFLNDSGFLETKMNLEGISQLLELDIILPNKQFEIRKEFTRKIYDLKSGCTYDNQIVNSHYKPFSYALTSKKKLNMTV
ncbi:hypothetical protein COL32_08920 [Bacillus pseudomycoides]|uniref:hypothetical protein n=1 Tax=Bacillus pseudomycoides TaxID=64104 RepID=UPI000BF381D7|nr:hypothetical protein [Bacillus pseudomycoides]PEP74103.1 hypothetical protein CN584_28020 [Bacillus pseudomycoides]PFW91357.1 hypothetical protein COL29_18985 [Bacillus pseudomycoides]PFX46064.1 hypothetical protein COL32_08920 [Bacillus pseudomycoides]